MGDRLLGNAAVLATRGKGYCMGVYQNVTTKGGAAQRR